MYHNIDIIKKYNVNIIMLHINGKPIAKKLQIGGKNEIQMEQLQLFCFQRQ